MAMTPTEARNIWLAAIASATRRDAKDIDKDSNWERYMSLAQIESAFDNTTAGLQSAGWKVEWTLAEVHASNPITAQVSLLAERATFIDGSTVIAAAIATIRPRRRPSLR